MSDAPQGVRDPCVGSVLGERYLVTRVLGVGGMATLYVAQHTMIGRMVAIKLLHHQFAQDVACVQRFLDEGRAAGTLGHPNIVESTDMGFAPDGSPFLVLELLEGVNLAIEIARIGTFPPQRAAGIGAQVASALDAAHARRIIHRDLKPENIFLIDVDHEHDHVKVLDFGISKFQGRSKQATQSGVVMGTPDFMAPEQISSPDEIDQRIDVYALGSILYTMLAGRAPFADVPFPLIFNRIQTESPPPLAELREDVPAPLVAIIERAMARAPDQRHQTMRELLAELLPFAGPVLPPSLTAIRRTPAPMTGRSVAAESADTLVATPAPAPTPAPVNAGEGGSTSSQIIVRRSPWLTVAVVISLLATLGTVVTVLVLRDRVAARAPSAGPSPSPDTALALYLDEAERLLGERRLGAARTVLDKAAGIEGRSAALDIRLARLREAVDVGELRAAAQAAAAAGDQVAVREAAGQILARLPGDAEATAMLEDARGAPSPAPLPAPPPVVETDTPALTSTPPKVVSPVRSAERDPAPRSAEPPRIARAAPPPSPPRSLAAGVASVDAGVRSAEPASVVPPASPPPVVAAPRTPVPPPVGAAPPRAADEIRAPRLPATYRVSSIKELTRVLSIVEKEAVDRGGAPSSVASGATARLGQSLFDAFVPGVVIELRPGDMYYAIVRGARAGRGRDQIGSELRSSRFYRTI